MRLHSFFLFRLNWQVVDGVGSTEHCIHCDFLFPVVEILSMAMDKYIHTSLTVKQQPYRVIRVISEKPDTVNGGCRVVFEAAREKKHRLGEHFILICRFGSVWTSIST